MIIFGTSSKTYQLAIVNLLCGFCGNPAAHALRKRVTRFSLFFVPLFPIAPAKHSMQCTFCGAQSDLSKENAEGLLARGGAPQGQQPAPQHPAQPQQGNPFAGGQQGGPQGPQNPYQS
ncbi:zinc-ribbon domain-containing protein [Streptomyces sp. JJ36]|uniref:zinc-ribbon domain-containing protein n=1 Tax=Streptomyces sp. JJ36 TaxID=2736645 RepID=UPI001F2D428E|nr:zinc-ribbon domain-containing protein [Streptomyces sp. JJ36]MCF6523252.1 zinc-ribbon domain-containing protein [Streptomyces sp. JJ36]